MEPCYIYVSLDVAKPGVQAHVHAKQNETGSRQLRIRLRNNSIPLKIAQSEGEYVILKALKPDGTLVFDDCSISGAYIERLLCPQILAAAGKVSCELAIYAANGQLLYSPVFELIVEKSGTYDDSQIESSDEFSSLQNLINQITPVTGSVAQSEAAREAAEAQRQTLYETVLQAYQNGSLKGDKGDAFTYTDFSAAELELLRGLPGRVQSINGIEPDAQSGDLSLSAADLGIKIQTFTSLEELGLSTGAGIAEVHAAMPAYSVLLINWTGASYTLGGQFALAMPQGWGHLVVLKYAVGCDSHWRWAAFEKGRFFQGVYSEVNNTGWSGWKCTPAPVLLWSGNLSQGGSFDSLEKLQDYTSLLVCAGYDCGGGNYVPIWCTLHKYNGMFTGGGYDVYHATTPAAANLLPYGLRISTPQSSLPMQNLLEYKTSNISDLRAVYGLVRL